MDMADRKRVLKKTPMSVDVWCTAFCRCRGTTSPSGGADFGAAPNQHFCHRCLCFLCSLTILVSFCLCAYCWTGCHCVRALYFGVESALFQCWMLEWIAVCSCAGCWEWWDVVHFEAPKGDVASVRVTTSPSSIFLRDPYPRLQH